MKPEIIRRIVVLPQPDGPRKEKNSPGWMLTDSHCRRRGKCRNPSHIVEIDPGAHRSPIPPDVIVRFLAPGFHAVAGLQRICPSLDTDAGPHEDIRRVPKDPAGLSVAAGSGALNLSAYSPRLAMNQACCSGHHHRLGQRVVVEGAVVVGRHAGSILSIAPLPTGLAEKAVAHRAEPSGGRNPLGELVRLIDVGRVLHQHEALVPGKGAFLRGGM